MLIEKRYIFGTAKATVNDIEDTVELHLGGNKWEPYLVPTFESAPGAALMLNDESGIFLWPDQIEDLIQNLLLVQKEIEGLTRPVKLKKEPKAKKPKKKDKTSVHVKRKTSYRVPMQHSHDEHS